MWCWRSCLRSWGNKPHQGGEEGEGERFGGDRLNSSVRFSTFVGVQGFDEVSWDQEEFGVTPNLNKVRQSGI